MSSVDPKKAAVAALLAQTLSAKSGGAAPVDPAMADPAMAGPPPGSCVTCGAPCPECAAAAAPAAPPAGAPVM